MQYLILLSALLSLAMVVIAQDVEPVFDEGGEATGSGPVLDEPMAAAAGFDEMDEINDW